MASVARPPLFYATLTLLDAGTKLSYSSLMEHLVSRSSNRKTVADLIAVSTVNVTKLLVLSWTDLL